MYRFLIFIFVIPLLAACGATQNSAEKPPWESISLDEDFIMSNHDFAFSLLKKVEESEESNKNILLSPTSITLALLLTANGAEGETRNEILNTLNLSNYSIDELNEWYKEIADSLTDGYYADLSIDNSIWVRKDLTLKKSFVHDAKTYYNAKATGLDLSDPNAVHTINNWVSDATNDRIPELLNEIPGNTLAYLINAVYFKANWDVPFHKEATADKPFYLNDGNTIMVPTMQQTGDFQYLNHETFEAVKIPYEDGRFYMTLFLPKEDKEAFYHDLHSNSWLTWNKGFIESYGTILLPRFEIEYELQLNDVLEKMGMHTAFYHADFSNMFEDNLTTYISEVKHKTFIEVNEEGTEAAAATSVAVAESGPPGEPFYLEFNKPFFFIIGDEATNTLLFVGEVNTPN